MTKPPYPCVVPRGQTEAKARGAAGIAIKAGEGLSEAESHALNAQLILMMNEVADACRLQPPVTVARSFEGSEGAKS